MRAHTAAILLCVATGAAAQEASLVSPGFELGVRYWLSTGATKHSHNAKGLNPSLGNPTSVLTYENLDAHVVELHGRLAERGWFLKGNLGVGRINRGSFDDEDFFAGQVKFSDTTSSVTEGTISYGTVDFGPTVWTFAGRLRLDAFAGYSQWKESVDAYGATDHLGGIGGDISRSVKVISNEATWQALRLGVAVDWAFHSRGRLSADLAFVPYAKVKNEDSHHLRTSPADLGPVPNIIIDGEEGRGVQLDLEARFALFRHTEVAAGLRYWYLKSTEGTRKAAGTSSPIVEIWSERAGVTLSLTQRW